MRGLMIRMIMKVFEKNNKNNNYYYLVSNNSEHKILDQSDPQDDS